MTLYLTIITTALVITQIIRVVQNAISLYRNRSAKLQTKTWKRKKKHIGFWSSISKERKATKAHHMTIAPNHCGVRIANTFATTICTLMANASLMDTILGTVARYAKMQN